MFSNTFFRSTPPRCNFSLRFVFVSAAVLGLSACVKTKDGDDSKLVDGGSPPDTAADSGRSQPTEDEPSESDAATGGSTPEQPEEQDGGGSGANVDASAVDAGADPSVDVDAASAQITDGGAQGSDASSSEPVVDSGGTSSLPTGDDVVQDAGTSSSSDGGTDGVPGIEWSSGFESDVSEWTVEGGLWEFGVGDVNEPLPHGGDALAGTVLGGLYTAHADARLISPVLKVPANTHQPRIKFAYWYDFAAGDYGQVQIRVKGDPWENVPAGTLNYRSKSWSQRVVDLSEYAGKEIQIAFRIVTDAEHTNTANTGYGWYVDDVVFETGPITIQPTESFEGDLGDWSVEGGVWAFGVGNLNEPEPRTGDVLAGTVLGDLYSPNADARLISPEFVVPSASEQPRAKFAYWYNFAAGDYGQLQIRIKGSDWEDVEGGTLNYSSKSWSQRVVDLAAFAGDTVQLAFRIVTDDQHTSTANTGFGWYVDDFSIETGQSPLRSPESFEGDLGDWSVEGGLWAFGVGNLNEPEPRTGDVMVGTVLGDLYTPNADARLISPVIAVPDGASAPVLRVHSWHDFDYDGHDSGQIQVRQVGGTWTDLESWTFSGSDKNWTEVNIDLEQYAGNDIQVGFRIVTDEEHSTSAQLGFGWYLDDVSLEGF